MRTFVVAFCVVAVATGFPSPEKFKPLVTACEGHDLLTNCTAAFHGVCGTSGGQRSCGQHHELRGLWKHLKALGNKMGLPHMKGGHHYECQPHLGDCGSKQDGEACTVLRPGQCIPSGKCPMFHGEMVCQPDDAHPPKFITEPCKGRAPGDDCKMLFFHGKCEKSKYKSDVVCKVRSPLGRKGAAAKDGEEELSVMVV